MHCLGTGPGSISAHSHHTPTPQLPYPSTTSAGTKQHPDKASGNALGNSACMPDNNICPPLHNVCTGQLQHASSPTQSPCHRNYLGAKFNCNPEISTPQHHTQHHQGKCQRQHHRCTCICAQGICQAPQPLLRRIDRTPWRTLQAGPTKTSITRQHRTCGAPICSHALHNSCKPES